MVERLLAGQDGDVNFIFEPSTSIFPTLQEADASGEVDFFDAPGTVWHYVSLNTADPANPQPGFDEEGNPIDQGLHPIFGDVRVRQALQSAVDINQIVEVAQNNNATPMVSSTIPNAFTISPTLERRPFDLEAAAALLDEAGWTDEDGNGIRECNGCLYATEVDESYEGTEMYFEIMAPDQPRTDVATILQDTFGQIGVDVEVLGNMDFNTMYDGNLGTQTFDAAVAGWRGGIPFNADQRSFFGAQEDIPGDGGEQYGFNFGSFYDAEFEELSQYIFAGAAADDCDEEAIKDAAYQVQDILWEQQPYLWLYAQNVGYAVRAGTENFDPFPAAGTWNINTWIVPTTE